MRGRNLILLPISIKHIRLPHKGTIMNEKPILFSSPMVRAILAGQKSETRRVCKLEGLEESEAYEDGNGDIVDPVIFCPYGKAGDHLWVRETFWIVAGDNVNTDFGIKYLADGTVSYWRDNADEMDYPIDEKKRPSIFMPRKFSRITLEIVNINVERLQDMTLDDCNAEGFICAEDFIELWDTIHKKDGMTFDKNPFCWVLTFKVI